jgi:copper(I)-binding protein
MKMATGRMTLVVLAFLTCATTTRAEDTSSGITVSHSWARATAPSAKNGAAFLTITAPPSLSDKLIVARSPAAERVQLHRHVMENGIAKMQSIAAIEVAPGKAVTLDPHGLHLMLVGLKSPLKEGDRITLTLVFEKSGDLPVEVPVLAANAAEPPALGKASPDSQTGGHDMYGHPMEKDHTH